MMALMHCDLMLHQTGCFITNLRSACLTGPGKLLLLRCLHMQAGDHTNHDYSLYFSFVGGCCDCGDPTSWKPSGFCPKHTGQKSRQQDNAHLDTLEEMVARGVLSWAVQELCRAISKSGEPVGKQAKSAAEAA